MKIVNYGDKYPIKFFFRISHVQSNFINSYCQSMSISSSTFMRRLIDNFMYSAGEELDYDENEIPDLNNQLQHTSVSSE